MKTDIDIKDDIYLLVKDSPIAEAVNGRIVRDGDRDTNSDKEDVVISVLANVNQQNQTATINVNIHVADLKKR